KIPGTALDYLVERLRKMPRVSGRGERRDELLDRRKIDRGSSAPFERGFVHLHRFAVQLDRLQDRLAGNRQAAELIGVTDEKNILPERIAEQRRRKFRRLN